MKKLLLILVVLFNIFQLKSQVVFCPPGAQWSYSFLRFNLSPQYEYDNVPIKYVRDSIIAGDTSHVLTHDRYFTGPNSYISMTSSLITLIKQRGDTVFMRNFYTHNEWQILYNFACTAGQCWQTRISPGPLTTSNVPVYTFCVDSVKYISSNGQNLKTLFIGTNLRVTERYGASTYLFPFDYTNISDGDYCADFLCYKDNVHGTKQFTSKPCDYSYITGLSKSKEEEKSFLIYPNPTQSILVMESKKNSAECEIKIINSLGQVIKHCETNKSGKTELNLSVLENGIYFIQVYDKENLIVSKKILKE